LVYGARLRYIPLAANGVVSVLYDFISMLLSLRYDAMLILGVSGAMFLPLIRVIYRGRIVVNIDGIEWKRAKWSRMAQLFLRLSEYIAVKISDVVISDNEVIRQHVWKSYGKKSVLIPYGGEKVSGLSEVGRGDVAIAVCRIEPENNVEMILEAYVINKENKLLFIGNWQKSRYSKGLYRKYSRQSNVTLLDPVYDRRELNVYRSSSSFYIHGHSAGGTNPSLVEAMSLGVPVCAFNVNFNVSTTRGLCKYFSSSSDLAAKVKSTSREEWSEIGIAMKRIADNYYTWDKIVVLYENAIRGV